jgi:putative copper resistance protein D
MVFHRAAKNADVKMLQLASEATQRFSSLGIAAMTILLLSGIINAWYMLADFAALFQSEYGELLTAKIAFFLVILVIAAVNRAVLTPKLANGAATRERCVQVLRLIRRNAILEVVLGVTVLLIVGKLGITIPAAHIHLH